MEKDDPLHMYVERSFPANTVTYLPNGNGKMKIYVNPGGLFDINILKFSGVSSYYYPLDTNNLYGWFSQILLALNPGNATGIEADITTEGETLALTFSNSADCVELIRKSFLPLLQNEEYRARLLNSIKDDKEISYQYTAIESGINALQKMLDSTTAMKLGFRAKEISEDDQEALYNAWKKYLPD